MKKAVVTSVFILVVVAAIICIYSQHIRSANRNAPLPEKELIDPASGESVPVRDMREAYAGTGTPVDNPSDFRVNPSNTPDIGRDN